MQHDQDPTTTGPKRKKPPACDRCKAKRVLCHPDPQGCPRCREKGIQCTTTPPARRASSTFASDSLPIPPPLAPTLASGASPPTVLPSPISAPRPAQILTFPTGSSNLGGVSNASFAAAASPFPLPSTDPDPVAVVDRPNTAIQAWHAPFFRTDASTSCGAAASRSPIAPSPPLHSIDALAKRVSTGTATLNPELSRHLYDAFRQSPHFDEGLVPVSSLLTSLTSSDWHVERLPLETQALVYSAFAIGTLYSYDASIIGPSPYTSFADLSSSSTGMDLREYGKRRRPAFEQMRELAMRAAREVDVWMEPTVDNAGTCNLLDIASRIDEVMSLDAPRTRPFHRAYISHFSHLISSDELPPGGHTRPAIRTIHLAGDVCADIGTGMVTASLEEQQIIAGSERLRTAAEIEQEYQSLLAAPVRDLWPDAHPICLVYLTTARTMANEIFAPHRRKAAVNVSALTRSFHAVLELQSLSALHAAVWDRIIAKTASSTTHDKDPALSSSILFPHVARRRVRWTRLLSAQAVGRFGAFVWATLVVPLVSELTRRVSNLAPTSTNTAPASASFAQQHEQAQLELLLRQARALVPLAVEAQIKLFERSPSLALLALSKPIGMAETFETWVELVECGHLASDAGLATGAARAIRLGGWVYSSLRLDNLVDRLDTIAASATASPDPLDAWTAQLFEMTYQDQQAATPDPASSNFDHLLGASLHSDLVDTFASLREVTSSRSRSGTATPNAFGTKSVAAVIQEDVEPIFTLEDVGDLPENASTGRGNVRSMWAESWPDESAGP
ncbi:hypothetical protein B0A53_03328 [Rhodotorula sp. CCFEE 5036]|nr:hypothetical protein B0A53_03328 [Rhodotorula sp. CCFEE 5036]